MSVIEHGAASTNVENYVRRAGDYINSELIRHIRFAYNVSDMLSVIERESSAPEEFVPVFKKDGFH